jgi:diacylglycerol kinase (ATP)
MIEDNKRSPEKLPTKKTGIPRLIAATGFSYAGLMAAFKHEEAFRVEVIAFCILAPFGIWLGESRLDQVALVGSLVLVLLMELINSAIEAIVDRAGKEHDVLAGRAKDIGSAAVFVALLFVVFVWAMLLL